MLNFRRARYILLACLLGLTPSLFGQSISITVASPPLPAYEQPPCPEDGYYWTPGYWAYGEDGYFWVPGVWEWRNGRHEWVSGHLVAERKGYRYAPDRWVRHDNEKWAFQRGGWNRDSAATSDRADSVVDE